MKELFTYCVYWDGQCPPNSHSPGTSECDPVRSRVFIDGISQSKMKSYGTEVGPNPVPGVFTRRGTRTRRDREGRGPRVQSGPRGCDRGTPRVAHDDLKLGSSREGSSLEPPGGGWSCRCLDFGRLASSTVRECISVVLNHQVHGDLLIMQPQETNTL